MPQFNYPITQLPDSSMKVAIIAVGSEMLTPFRVDTNSLLVTEKLNAIGGDIRLKVVVGDDVEELVPVLKSGRETTELVVCTGGLGPTEDDITRDAIARVLDVPLDVNEAVIERILARFARRGLTMPSINRRQGMVPRGAELVDNPNGTAPGLWIEHDGKTIIALPGPPREMTPMIEALIRDKLAPKSAGNGLFRRGLRIPGRTESDVDSCAEPIYSRWVRQRVPISTTILAVFGQIELHLTAAAPSRAAADVALDAAVTELRDALGASVYIVDGGKLVAVVGALLREAQWTIAIAESCTGGLLTSRLTDVPGSSAYVDRGVVCYSNRAKTELLGVPEELIEQFGAVSEQVARAMAEGVRARAGAVVGIGVTGIAGPDGGTPEKPVGTVAVAIVAGEQSWIRTFQFIGDREQVKYQATQ